MQAIVIREHDSREELRVEERALPVPGPGELRVAVRAAVVDPLDVELRQRVVPAESAPPRVPGRAAAGVVDAVGAGVSRRVCGDAVVVAPASGCGDCARCASGRDDRCVRCERPGVTRDGTWAAAVVVPERGTRPLPAGLSFEEAAGIGVSFQPAWHLLHTRARLGPNEVVVVHEAGGAVAAAAIQLGVRLGARVLFAGSDPRKLERARELGAEEAIDRRCNDFVQVVIKRTAKRGADVVLDPVGGPDLAAGLRCLGAGGRLVTCGFDGQSCAAIDAAIMADRGLSILGARSGTMGELFEVLQAFECGELRPIVERVLPLAQVAEARRAVEEGLAFGSVVLTPAMPGD